MVHPCELGRGSTLYPTPSLHPAAKRAEGFTARGESTLTQKCISGGCPTSQLLSHTQKLLVCSGIKTFPHLSDEHDAVVL